MRPDQPMRGGVAVPPAERGQLAPLLSAHGELGAIISGVLHGGLGTMSVDDLNHPTVARLSIGCYEVFGGDSNAPDAARFVETTSAPRELIYGNDPAWRRLLLRVHGPRVTDRPMRSFDASQLAENVLGSAAGRLGEGFQLRELDPSLTRQLDPELEPHALQVYASPEAFLAQGFGFGAVADGQLACAATTYAVAPGHVEVAIATRPAFRGRGLALAVGARFVLRCIQNGARPHWNASNPISQRLAIRLGFRAAGTCEVLYLR
jgi:GNAT superfamily N-acetyltransferase